MEFFGVEVLPGKAQTCTPGDDMYCHVSQAALGVSSNGKQERVVVKVQTGGMEVVLGTLNHGKCDQMTLDLIFDREFQLSHTGTSSSVFICGYKTDKGEEEESDDSDEDYEVTEGVPVKEIKENGDVAGKAGAKTGNKEKESSVVGAGAQSLKAQARKLEAHTQSEIASFKDDEAEEGSDEDDEDDEDDDEGEDLMINSMLIDLDSDMDEDDSQYEMDEGDSSAEESDDLDDGDSDEDDDEDDEDSEDEDPRPNVVAKRPQKAADLKSPGPGKKARVDSSAAKPGLITTPAPSKKAPKASLTPTPTKVTSDKNELKGTPAARTPQKTPKAKTPKSASTPGDSAKKLGDYKCADCDRLFTGESALSQHAKAKHKK